ncbi:MAG: ABC transporter ATP-binding protein [Gammaproteobacteria bacterium]|nr:ABC transporter ATP-binding protein [Gammaproteobacteria bacterium]
MLDIRGLSYQIGGNQILRELDLHIAEQQYYALAGENGAGKSTLIKIILDLIRNIESGSVKIGGVDRRQVAARQRLSYLPEKFDIKREVTGWQYLHFVAGVYRKILNQSRVEQLCEQLSLDVQKLELKASVYSKGMKQKLGLISCFMLDNPLIILDEPLSGLDPKARFYFKQLLNVERANQRTIFYSTHMLADAEEISDQFGILHQGRIVFEGSPQACLQTFSADTLEQAYMNCITRYPKAVSSDQGS